MHSIGSREPRVKCATCDGFVQGVFDGILLSVCCVRCCAKATTAEGVCTVSAGRAASEYRCSSWWLRFLDCKERRQSLRRVYHLYLLAEVQHLAKLQRKATQRSRFRGGAVAMPVLLKRRQLLLSFLNITEAEFGDESKRVPMIFLLRRCLRPWQRRTDFEELRKCWDVFPRVQRILQHCPRAHPDAVFDFCLQNPKAGPAEFCEEKQKTEQIFRLCGEKIMKYVDDRQFPEVPYLLDTPLEKEYLDFKERHLRLIHSNLLKYVDSDTADEMMIEPDSRRQIRYGNHEPQVAQKLVEAWNARCLAETTRQYEAVRVR